MGGAVSSGRDNDELIDNLMSGNYIRTRDVERVFRALDRAEYITPDTRDHAYTDQAWRNGPLHLSAPCIYSEVLEGLELKPGMSFLNVGSGTGYFSTLVGLILGSGGINHGVEVHSYVVEYAIKKLGQFIENSATLDEFDFCEPKFYCGNGLCLAPLQAPYDRVYCGAGCPAEYENYFKQLVKVGGVLVMPLNDSLVQVRRTGDDLWSSRNLLNVSFATLRVPTKDETAELLRLDEQSPPRLQVLCRAVVRRSMRAALLARNPQLREPPPAPPQPRNACPRRISIPIEEDSDVEGLNALHDLEGNGSGANEMNALLSLVLSMGHNRVAGALRFDALDSPSDSSTDEDEELGGNDGEDGDDPPDGADPPAGDDPPDGADPPDDFQLPALRDNPMLRGSRSITFQFGRERAPDTASDGSRTPPLPRARADAPRERPGINGVPAEVEIYLGKEVAGTSRTAMDWEGAARATLESSSEDETTETCKEQTRQKLDSGIGEGETSSGSSPVKMESKSDESEADAVRSTSSEIFTDDVDDDNIGARRRLAKRARCALGLQSSSSTECEDSAPEAGAGAEGAGAGRRRKRRARLAGPTAPADAPAAAPAPAAPAPTRRVILHEPPLPRAPRSDARRVRLSVMMKLAVKDLPLPYALKKYVNLGRAFAISAV